MLRSPFICGVIACLLAVPHARAQFEQQPHPRLWLRSGDEAAIKRKIAEDPLAAKVHRQLLAEADLLLNTRTCRHEIPDGRRLLGESRRALHQTMTCAWAFRMTGDKQYLARAVAELEAACAMKDWNPSHFLDTAEMATAVAVGYDWLFHDLTPDQRKRCETAIRDKALQPADNLYKTHVWWNNARNNWSQVCGSGIAIAAIATQGNDQGLAADLIRRGTDLVSRCTHFYQPDGVYPEGPGYWHYGTNYHVMFLAACEALGHPADVPPLLEQSGDSMLHLHGPTQLPFNFADGKAHPQSKTPAQAWIASHFHNHAQASDFRHVLAATLEQTDKQPGQKFSPLQVIWLPAAPADTRTMPLNASYRGEQATATFRTGWQPDDAWLAIKGGTPAGGHSQMDVGSFCYDAKGQRWIHDLGSDNYNMPGYFGSDRFTYFRNQNRSHNTLEINGQLQDPQALPSPLTGSCSDDVPATASFDLTPAYHESASAVSRTVEFDTRTGTAVIRDDIKQPAGDVVWRAMTDARVTIDGPIATLSKQGKSITLERLSDHGCWTVEDASPPQAIENPNTGFYRLTLTVPKKSRTTIKVAIRP